MAHGDEAKLSEAEVVRDRAVGVVWLALIGAVAAAVAAFVAVGRGDPGDGEAVSGAATTTLPSPATGPAVVQSDDTDSAGLSDRDTPQPSVRSLRPPSHLEGPVALLPFPEGTEEADDELFVLEAGGVRSRADLPLWPGDSVDPMVMGAGRIVFVTFPSRVFAVPVDLWSTDPEPVGPGSYLVPGDAPGQVWIVDADGRQVSGLDLRSASVGETIALPEAVWWVHAATAHGFVVSVDADPAWGPDRVALLARVLEPLDGLPADWVYQPPQAVTGGGDFAVLGWDGYLAVVDVARDRLVFDIDLAYGRLWAACLSPDRQHLAIKGDGEVKVVDLSDGEVVEFSANEGLNTVAWTSDDRLVIVRDGFVDVVGVDGALYPPLAELNGSSAWSVAAIGHSC